VVRSHPRSVVRGVVTAFLGFTLTSAVGCGGERSPTREVKPPPRSVDELLDVYEDASVIRLSTLDLTNDAEGDAGRTAERIVDDAVDTFVGRQERQEEALAELSKLGAPAVVGFSRRLEAVRDDLVRRQHLLRGLVRLPGRAADAAVERVASWPWTDVERGILFSTLAERREPWALALALRAVAEPPGPRPGDDGYWHQQDVRRSIRRLALGVLVSWDDPAARAAVAAAVTAPDADQRADALRVLGGPTFRGDVGALSVFVRALDDPAEPVAFAAEGRLDALVDERLAPALERVPITSDDAAFEAALTAAAAARRKTWAPWLAANRANLRWDAQVRKFVLAR
jgi:hypothetical protein